MLHSQLKIKLPDCPYIWDQHDLRQTYDFKQESLTCKHILDDIKELFTEFDDDDNFLMDECLNFLKIITQDSADAFTAKHYSRVIQTIPQHKKDVLLNFHTAAYNDDNGSLVDKEFSSVVSWLIIPIVGDIRTHSVGYTINKKINKLNNCHSMMSNPITLKTGDTNQDVMMNTDMARALDPKTYTDNGYEKVEAVVRTQRTSMRHFIVRDLDPIKVQKRDVTIDTSVTMTQSRNLVEPRKQQIVMNNNTRFSACVIRDRLLSSYKAHRIKNNPESVKHQSRVDLSLCHASNHVANTLNQTYRALERDVNKDAFDYTYDQVGTKMFSAIYKFHPTLCGRIGINTKNNDKGVYFVTVMRHKTNLHITLHEVKFK